MFLWRSLLYVLLIGLDLFLPNRSATLNGKLGEVVLHLLVKFGAVQAYRERDVPHDILEGSRIVRVFSRREVVHLAIELGDSFYGVRTIA